MNGPSGPEPGSRRARLGRIIGGVVRQAVADARAAGVRILEADSPEGRLLGEWCREVLGDGRVFTGHVEARAVHAHPATKTALLLDEPPPAPLLPLGDLYASEVAELTGDWSGSDAVRELAGLAGGIGALDGVLRAWADERRPLAAALAPIGAEAAAAVAAAVQAQRWRRWRLGLVPKLGGRTLGIDLWE